MALSESSQRKLAYFHSLGKSMIESQQNVYESNYKSSHNIRTNEIWSDNIDFTSTYSEAKTKSLLNNAVILHEMVFLSEVYGSNGQAYIYIENGKFKDSSYPISDRGYFDKINPSLVEPKYIKPFISPEDVVDTTTNDPSFGYTLRLFRENGMEIFLTEGTWVVNYNTGIIYFDEGYTPSDMGWGNIKASFFEYNGNYLDTALYDMNKDNIHGVTFVNNVLYFTQQDGDIIIVNLNDLQNISGLTSRISSDNNNMNAKNTSHINKLTCDTPLLSNLDNSSVIVFINGIQVNLDSNDTCDCYFSNDGGVTKKQTTNISMGDYLYWNYNINGVPLSGYDLSNIDKITFIHLSL